MGGKWSLGRNAFIPHISLYHIPVREKDFQEFMRELASISKEARIGELKATGFDMPVLTISKPQWLDDLHRRIVLRTVRYFDRSYGAEGTWRLNFFTGRRREFAKRYLDLYGTPMFGMNFRPHITLTSFAGDGPQAFAPNIASIQFKPDRLTVCELGVSHSCQRVIAEIPLGAEHPS